MLSFPGALLTTSVAGTSAREPSEPYLFVKLLKFISIQPQVRKNKKKKKKTSNNYFDCLIFVFFAKRDKRISTTTTIFSEKTE
jgi:hypothetical protein